MERIEMVDLKRQYERLKHDMDAAIQAVIESGQYINGPEVAKFEQELSQYLSVKHVIACANGTDALTAALMSLNLNVGDEVITSSFSFIATAEAITILGLKPVFADIDPHTFNISPESIVEKITPRTRAIIPVNLFGQTCPMDEITSIAQKHGLFVVEDSAQNIGASHKIGEKTGVNGDIGCTSFFPSKNLGCMGDGGAIFTNNELFASRIRRIVNHGSEKKYHHTETGINSRLDTVQAAILRVKLPQLDDFIRRRQVAAQWYNEALKEIEAIETPITSNASEHVWHQYTIRIKNGKRNELQEYLREHGIPSMIYYPVPLHKQPVYADSETSLPEAELASQQVLSLPMHTELTGNQLKHITDTITSYFSRQ